MGGVADSEVSERWKQLHNDGVMMLVLVAGFICLETALQVDRCYMMGEIEGQNNRKCQSTKGVCKLDHLEIKA